MTLLILSVCFYAVIGIEGNWILGYLVGLMQMGVG